MKLKISQILPVESFRKFPDLDFVTMAPSLLAYNAARLRPYVCARCAQKQLLPRLDRRGVARLVLWRNAAAGDKWRAQMGEIRGGNKDSMLKILEDRGYVHAIAG